MLDTKFAGDPLLEKQSPVNQIFRKHSGDNFIKRLLSGLYAQNL